MQLAKTYQPRDFEAMIYAMWEAADAFSPSGTGEPYSIVMPPPNANGNLHVGHALTIGIQDVLTRYHRMQGRRTIYIPGADHAGFETWVVFDKQLAAQKKSRLDFSREQLYKMVWDFVASKRGDMELQIRALGASCSWKDLVFTLDAKVIETVYSTFKRLWDDDLVYRGERIVNYSTQYQTSYADIEVDYKSTKAKLYKVAYPTIDNVGEVVIATTRPETIFGDVAIAVNPNDKRYKDLIGKKALVPIIKREIPIIGDDYVDIDYGTGALKITPAHDPNDFEIGQRHNLKPIQVIGFDGKMTNVPASFEGLTALEARKAMIGALKSEELFRGEEDIEHVVGYDYKSGLPIEPMIKDQWFLKIEPLAQKAIQALEDNKITFYPETKKPVLINYLKNLRDWNLSRQIAWGIPIPAFVNIDDKDDWIFDTRVNEEIIEKNGKTYRREEDTFDTWFSSGQWPYITTDYVEQGSLAEFFPTTLMETGFDLLDRWVARMIMLSLYVTGEVPFKDVYLHGMVLDERGQKMSKSKGNVINPMVIVNEYGSDALRMGIIANRSVGQNQAFTKDKVVAARNFCNKLWNIARYIQTSLPSDFVYDPNRPIVANTEVDHWILATLDQAIVKIDEQIETYHLAEAVDIVYQTIWSSVADWYLEASKKQPNYPLMVYVLETILKLAHPFAPFVTETIWQSLIWREDLVINQPYPAVGKVPSEPMLVGEFSDLITLVTQVRAILKELPAKQKYRLLHANDQMIESNGPMIKHLTKVKEVVSVMDPAGLKIISNSHQIWLELDKKAMAEYQANLEIKLIENRAKAAQLSQRLANADYVAKAPAELVAESKVNLTTAKEAIARIQGELSNI